MKKIISVLLCIYISVTFLVTPCQASNQENEPKKMELFAKAAVLLDADSGRILYSKNGTTAMANASTTKILTCILALEYCELNTVVTASNRAAAAPKVHLGMHEGQCFYMKDLLYALMLESYNDCAIAIAEYIAGSVEAFAEIMNHKAREIGCKDTYFITPNGLDATDSNGFHHTTAADLALIMRYCIHISEKSEEFRTITAARTYQFCEIENGTSYSVYNHNAFLDMMQGAFSGKTGFTGNAGYCYVGALNRDGKTLIVALLACGWPNNRTYKWSDAKKLMTYGLENFEKVRLSEIPLDQTNLEPVLVKNGQGTTINELTYAKLIIGDTFGIDEVLLNRKEEIKISYDIKKNWLAPVKKGTYAGKICISVNGEIMRVYEILLDDEIDKIDFLWSLQMVFSHFLNGISI